jgi:hypothetical protein
MLPPLLPGWQLLLLLLSPRVLLPCLRGLLLLPLLLGWQLLLLPPRWVSQLLLSLLQETLVLLPLRPGHSSCCGI